MNATAAQTPTGNEAAPCLRRDLRCSLHENRGDRFFLIEDPARESFFRLGLSEWQFAIKLDGKTPVADAFASVREELGEQSMTPEKAQSVCRWLTQSGLLKAKAESAPAAKAVRKASGPALMMSAFFFRIPLVRPDRWLNRIVPLVGWLFTLPALLVWTALVALGCVNIAEHWDRFQASTAAYFSPSMWIYLAAVWIALKIVHELFHALACKHFGGNVGSSGIAFILFAPVAYVDVTSAWRFRSKWHRIWTSAAGIYVEFAIAAVAALIWARSGSPWVQNICHSVIMAASVTTVLFNGNPLMRFDGYYILTDLLEIQNLYGLGREHVRRRMRRWFFKLPTNESTLTGSYAHLVQGYGWCSAAWRLLVCGSMMLGAATLFHGAGILLAVVAGLAWFAKPTFDLMRYLMNPPAEEQPSRMRFFTLTGLIVLISAIAVLMPFPGGVSAPAIIDFEPLNYVRAEANGFVERVQVNSGQAVKQDDVMMTIRNDELGAQLAKITAELKQAKIRARILHRDDDVALYQAEQEEVLVLTDRQSELQRQIRGLTVRAPSDGTVLSRNLSRLEGQYVELGSTLIVVGDETSKAVLTSIPEEYVEAFTDKIGDTPRVWVSGYGEVISDGKLVRVDPSATDVLRHPALGGQAGGPIPVRAVNSSDRSGSEPSQFRMVAPMFHAVVNLSEQDSLRLEAGQLAEVRFTDSSESVGRKVHRVATAWIRSKLVSRSGN